MGKESLFGNTFITQNANLNKHAGILLLQVEIINLDLETGNKMFYL